MYFQLNFFVVLLSFTFNFVTCKSGGDIDMKAITTLVTGLSGMPGGDSAGGALGKALAGLGLGSGSDSSSEMVNSELESGEIKKYFNEMAKKEERLYKKALQKQMSDEEKDQVKYYENLLSKIKSLQI